MDLPLKLYLTLYIMEIMMILGVSNISSQIQVMNAQNYSEDAVAQIENSNFNPNVINAIISQGDAENLNYEISITIYNSNNTKYCFTTPVVSASNTKDTVMGEILIKYKTKNPFLGYEKVKEIRRYIR